MGGGIGGSTFAKTMADYGVDVLVIERESTFRDRVRGEWIAPWGVAEAKRLNVYNTIINSGGHELRYIRGNGGDPKDLKNSTRCHNPHLLSTILPFKKSFSKKQRQQEQPFGAMQMLNWIA